MALDFINEVNFFKSNKQTFFLIPKLWEELELGIALPWKRIHFIKGNRRHVPTSPGIYAFIVSNRDANVPPNGYIMYIGIAGHKGSGKHDLKQRFSEYLSEEKILKRPLITYMLNNWKGHIDFHYAELSPDQHDLKQIEKELCDAVIPPCNRDDFSAEIKSIIKGAW